MSTLGIMPIVQGVLAEVDLTAKCADLVNSLNLPDTTVWFSQSIPANTNVSLPENHPTCAIPSQPVSVDLCRVSMLTTTSPTSNISLEAWLPLEWNGRFLGTGNGGLDGCIRYGEIAYGVSQGFATFGTNNGHNGTSGEPLYQNPGAVEDFAYRSLHLGTALGKQVTEAFYGKKHSKSYFMGCSSGGRQGFKEAQDFPGDFDGIVAGAPGFAVNDLFSWMGSFYPISGTPGSPTFVEREQWASVLEDVLAQCDGLDGVVDGLIEDPDLCQYRPEALLCSATDPKPNCLTGAQAQTVRAAFSDLHGKDGILVYPRLQPGGNPAVFMTGNPFPYTVEWFRYVVYSDPSWDPATLGPDDYAAATELNPFNIQTWEGDLSEVRDQGTKVLHYHGLEDPVISNDNSQRYYNHVARTMGLTYAEMDDFYRYFRISGMSHCYKGNGAWRIGNGFPDSAAGYEPEKNVLWAIVKWVEEGIAPEHIEGTSDEAHGSFSRRHCKYPLRGRYTGSGGAKDPDSWECV
ncbi:the tannase [Amphichorda felina]